jgi:gamma-glutamyltranspeptidase
MAFRNGKPWMAFGTMGGDNQGQWLLQYYLCVAVFGMSIPEAIEAPRLSSEHTPGFFAPHAAEPNRVRIEPRFGGKVLEELRRRGTISTLRRIGPKDSSLRRRSTKTPASSKPDAIRAVPSPNAFRALPIAGRKRGQDPFLPPSEKGSDP